MSATITASGPATPSTNGQPLSPVDYVRSLSPESKEEVLAALLLELIDLNNGGYGCIPFKFSHLGSMGYYVPPRAAEERRQKYLAELPPSVRAELGKPLPPDFDPDDCLTDEEVRAILRGEEMAELK